MVDLKEQALGGVKDDDDDDDDLSSQDSGYQGKDDEEEGAVVVEDDDDEDDNSNSASRNSSSQSSSRHSTTGHSSSNNSSKVVVPPPVIVDIETRNVYCAKLVMIGVVSMAAVASAMATFLFTTAQVDDEFEQSYSEYANRLIDASQLRAENYYMEFQALSLGMTSFANGVGAGSTTQWPNVTLPIFEAQAGILARETSADWLALLPFVEKDRGVVGWESYVQANHASWIDTSRQLYGNTNATSSSSYDVSPYIFRRDEQGHPVMVDNTTTSSSFYAPTWQITPPTMVSEMVNYNQLDVPMVEYLLQDMMQQQDHPPHGSMSAPLMDLTSVTTVTTTTTSNDVDDQPLSPRVYMTQPVLEQNTKHYDHDNGNRNENDLVVAMLLALVPMETYFQDVLSMGQDGILVVIQFACNKNNTTTTLEDEDDDEHYDQVEFTYQINGPHVEYLGAGDLHAHPRWTSYEIPGMATSFPTFEQCEYSIRIYPSDLFQNIFYTSNRPAIYTAIVVLIFGLTAMVFCCYDCVVGERQDKVTSRAATTDAIVDSFYPSYLRDRVLQEETAQKNLPKHEGGGTMVMTTTNIQPPATKSAPPVATNNIVPTQTLNEVLGGDILMTKPIADLFPHATVMFADIVGFTAWSSVRDPPQVFTLLETLYNSFDKIAARRRIFKVETIGDCYLAAAGVPDARQDHALVMARFARDCLTKMRQVVHQLEFSLGPDTGELTMRLGLHSGPVTGGVLRGEKSRFQLFGDTINIAARMESTSARDKIQISQETANLLMEMNKQDWIRPRDDVVVTKGKGEMHTFWLLTALEMKANTSKSATTTTSGTDKAPSSAAGESDQLTAPETTDSTDAGGEFGDHLEKMFLAREGGVGPWSPSVDKYQRLVGWNVDVLKRGLQKIVAMRTSQQGHHHHHNHNHRRPSHHNNITNNSQTSVDISHLKIASKPGETVLDEVKEVIPLDNTPRRLKIDPEDVDLGEIVLGQLQEYVQTIAILYRENHFHNFQHAGHVAQSLTKLLSRVVAPEQIDYDDMVYKKVNSSKLHKFTYGITSDPIIQFACSFSALIHDVDHQGVPNAQLVQEGAGIAGLYGNKSVAEQNSVDIAWELLMDNRFADLRACIYTNQTELDRFRQLVVNSVMATDIVDKELGALRKRRWEKAFSSNMHSPTATTDAESILTDSNRKATIVIEHLIQAADVGHTMQHWHVYRKWNERFFREMYKAYKSGRNPQDPSIGWYQGELGFFDFYIIPLAKKLEECGVFGVSSDECLNYALQNRNEWAEKGEGLVKSYLAAYEEIEEEGTKQR